MDKKIFTFLQIFLFIWTYDIVTDFHYYFSGNGSQSNKMDFVRNQHCEH